MAERKIGVLLVVVGTLLSLPPMVLAAGIAVNNWSAAREKALHDSYYIVLDWRLALALGVASAIGIFLVILGTRRLAMR